MSETVHDIVAIGCGPFNLGLGALASTLPGLDLVILEAEAEIRWHRGVMFDDATMQVSFLADLVTLVDPTHPLSFLAYLRDVDRMYPFYVRERFHITRQEYELYLGWAASKLSCIRFAHRVLQTRFDAEADAIAVSVATPSGAVVTLHARHLVVGIGTAPFVPDALASLPAERLVHSGSYLDRSAEIMRARAVTVIGSGQSGAEVVLDLLRRPREADECAFSWLTRTESFAPLDYTKLVLEMTTPEYVKHFHALPEQTRDALVRNQWRHYKGISQDTLEEIHELLYRRTLHPSRPHVELRCGIRVEAAAVVAGKVVLDCVHVDTGTRFEHRTDLVLAATGYRHRPPHVLEGLGALLLRDDAGRYKVRLDHALEAKTELVGRVFVAHSDTHSHGVAAPDLGICAVRNATILNTVLGHEVYRLPQRTAFTRFDPPAARG